MENVRSAWLYGLAAVIVVVVALSVYVAGFLQAPTAGGVVVDEMHGEKMAPTEHHEEMPAVKEADESHQHGGDEHGEEATAENLEPTVEFTLVTRLDDKGFAYVGKSKGIEGVRNPTLRVKAGDVVKITIVKEDVEGIQHDFAIEGLGVHVTEHVESKGDVVEVVFRVEKPGEYAYYCSIPGHREAGMEGLLIVEE